MPQLHQLSKPHLAAQAAGDKPHLAAQAATDKLAPNRRMMPSCTNSANHTWQHRLQETNLIWQRRLQPTN
jgi:hypothetical protein